MALIRLAISGFLLVSVICTSVQAETRLRSFAPASDWVMDYGEDSCALRRAFADSRGRVVFIDIRQYSPNAYLTFTVYSSDVERVPEAVRFRFEPDDDNTDTFSFALDLDDSTRGVRFAANYLREDDQPDDFIDFLMLPLATFQAREREITSFVVLEGFEVSMDLQTGSMLAPMNAMRTCLDDLMTSWGLEPVVQRSLSRPLEINNQAGMAQDLSADFPRAMIRDRQAATMTVRLLVEEDGRVSDCKIIGMVGEPEYGEAACASFSRYVRFSPALDADGNPVPSVWTTDLSYWTQ